MIHTIKSVCKLFNLNSARALHTDHRGFYGEQYRKFATYVSYTIDCGNDEIQDLTDIYMYLLQSGKAAGKEKVGEGGTTTTHSCQVKNNSHN